MTCSLTHLNVLLADGETKPIGHLKVGDKVDTLHQESFKRGKYKILSIKKEKSKLLALDFEGEKIECYPNHRFYCENKRKWIKAKDLNRGTKVLGLDGYIKFTDRKKIGEGEVIHLDVEGAHTYVSGKVLSHNKGNVTYNPPPPPPPDKTFENYLKYQRERDEDAEYRDWLGGIQKYKGQKGKQTSGRAGWDAHKASVQNKLSKNLISFTQAEKELKDYATDYNLAAGSINYSGGDDPRQMWDRYKDKDGPDGGWTTAPTYETPDRWQNWSVNKALTDLGTFYHGGAGTSGAGTTGSKSVDGSDDGLAGGVTNTGGLLGKRRDTNIKAAYEEILGRSGTADEIATAKERFGSGYYSDIDSFKTGLTSSSEYKDKFQRSYLENYYDTMYGKEERDESGNRTGTRTFNFDKSLLPDYSGDLEGDTGVKLPEWKDQYKGTPAEIDFAMDNIRESRKFLYSAGLTNLQGSIDKEVQKLKNEGGKEITRIGKEGDMYASVVNAFNF